MKSNELWQVSARVTASIEEALAEVWLGTFEVAPISHLDLRTGILRVSVYLEKPRAWVEERCLRARATWGERGLAARLPRFTIKAVRQEDWAESWKRHFRPLQVSDRLLIRPSWSGRKARPGQRVLVLDPGLSFGTGQHPTTGFCLSEIDRAAIAKPGFSLLDVGTGSGILALAAAKLGAVRVDAFDFDPVAIRVAQENARRNRLADRVTLRRGDVAALPLRGIRYDVICANLTADLLEAHLGRMAARLVPGGVLVLAGILRRQFADVEAACASHALSRVRSEGGGEWRSGSFSRGRG
jgi:ribosomal protein L11 methyltransferase